VSSIPQVLIGVISFFEVFEKGADYLPDLNIDYNPFRVGTGAGKSLADNFAV